MIVEDESESDEDSVAAIDLDLVAIVKDEREKTHVGLKLVYVARRCQLYLAAF